MNIASIVIRSISLRLLIAGIAFWGLNGPMSLHAQLSEPWRWSNPRPHGANIRDQLEAFGQNLQIAENGQIFTSTSLTTWKPLDTGTHQDLRSATLFGGRLFVVGEKGLVLWSDNLSTFETATLSQPTENWFEGVAASASQLVAVGDNAEIQTSRDGENWTRQSVTFTNWLRSVAYGSSRFVAAGDAGFIATSSDGQNWTPLPGGLGTSENLKKVRYLGTSFWVTGDAGTVFNSSGGLDWSPVDTGTTNTLFDVGAELTTRLVTGRGTVQLRRDGSWSDQTDGSLEYPAPVWTYTSLLSSENLYLLGGRSGMTVEGFRTNLTSSTFVWVQRQPSFRDWLWEVQRLEDIYVAVGDRGTIASSASGIRWTLESVPDEATNRVLLGVGGNDTRGLIAGGSQGTLLYSPPGEVELTSTNTDGTVTTNRVSSIGIVWQNTGAGMTTNDLQGVVHWNDQFYVSGGNGTVLHSADGTNWLSTSTPTQSFLSGLAAWPGGLVASGSSGALLTSTNGETWNSINSGTTDWLFRVRYLNGELWAVGNNGTLLNSADGTTWDPINSGTTSWLNDIVWFDPSTVTYDHTCFGPVQSSFFAIGNQGAVVASEDGATWEPVAGVTGKSLFGAAVYDGQLITCGIEGVIIRRRLAPNCTPTQFIDFETGSDFDAMLIQGNPDQQFQLQNSTNLVDFATNGVFEIQSPSGSIFLLNPKSTNAPPSRYYRNQLLP